MTVYSSGIQKKLVRLHQPVVCAIVLATNNRLKVPTRDLLYWYYTMSLSVHRLGTAYSGLRRYMEITGQWNTIERRDSKDNYWFTCFMKQKNCQVGWEESESNAEVKQLNGCFHQRSAHQSLTTSSPPEIDRGIHASSNMLGGALRGKASYRLSDFHYWTLIKRIISISLHECMAMSWRGLPGDRVLYCLVVGLT